MYADQVIKRCPFCNGSARLRHSIYTKEQKFEIMWSIIECPDCAASIYGPSIADIINKWNTRKGERYEDDLDPFIHVVDADSDE